MYFIDLTNKYTCITFEFYEGKHFLFTFFMIFNLSIIVFNDVKGFILHKYEFGPVPINDMRPSLLKRGQIGILLKNIAQYFETKETILRFMRFLVFELNKLSLHHEGDFCSLAWIVMGVSGLFL